MRFSTLAASLCSLAAFLPTLASAQHVFAHVVVGNNGAYTEEDWKTDIRLAASKGIDAFVLNIGTPYQGTTATQMSYAFLAANALRDDESLDFKLFFSFDYLGGTAGAWPQSDVISILQDYGPNGAYFHYDGRPFVSTFEGTDNVNDWPTIRAAVDGGIYFVPDWTSLGPTGNFNLGLVDGAFSWDMWPNGPANINTTSDNSWTSFLSSSGKSYMMGVSPWFYTDLPQYGKAFVWRGDNAWSARWDQTHEILPPFVQIVTWNDYGESHYIGPIEAAGIPSGAEEYVNGYPHTGWLETLPYEIAAYKHAYAASTYPAPSIAAGKEKIVFWYRTSPASAGTTDVQGNNCYSAVNYNGYQSCYAISDILEDEVFAIVLASTAGTATISIAGSTSSYNIVAGKNFITKPFNGNTGTVSVAMGGISGSGKEITAQPDGGEANFNAWVGCAGFCSETV